MDLFRRLYIIVADDNRDVAATLSSLLKLVGFEIATVHDGREAVATAISRPPDVLVLDIGLPGLDGHEVARRFRSEENLKNVLIVATSGYSPDMLPGRCKHGDFDHYLVKPVDFRTLLPLLGKIA
jgi:CheY-like chemotaxis protein